MKRYISNALFLYWHCSMYSNISVPLTIETLAESIVQLYHSFTKLASLISEAQINRSQRGWIFGTLSNNIKCNVNLKKLTREIEKKSPVYNSKFLNELFAWNSSWQELMFPLSVFYNNLETGLLSITTIFLLLSRSSISVSSDS